MAERRMFAKTIIDSDAFLDMPLSTQSLYFHLAMRADDDGFVNNPKKIQRLIGASDDDCKLLIAKSFILTFESGIIVIKHWKIHNYIRGDRKKDTTYKEEKAMLTIKENGAYSLDASQPIPAIEETITPRQKAYKESTLPYSFEYKIREYFKGKKCPICGAVMNRELEDGIITENRIPTIQHNKPISKGGKHELGNISVICRQCNVTIQDKETEELNAQEVIDAWDEITKNSNDCQVSDKCLSNDGIGKVRLGKDRLGKVSIDKTILDKFKSVLSVLKTKTNPTTYGAWFANLKLCEINENTLTACDNKIVVDVINDNYQDLLRETVKEVYGNEFEIVVKER